MKKIKIKLPKKGFSKRIGWTDKTLNGKTVVFVIENEKEAKLFKEDTK